MSHKIEVQFGGAADATVHDYSDRVRLYLKDGSRGIFGGMHFANGDASTGEFPLMDWDSAIPLGDADNLQVYGRNKVTWIEDSPGYDALLSVGRVAMKYWARPNGQAASVAHEARVQWDDANNDFHGLSLLSSVSRPSESAFDRVKYFVETYAQGDPRPSTDITFDADHLIGSSDDFDLTMDAVTYKVGTPITEIIEECNDRVGKIWGVAIHQDADENGDHLCFEWVGETNHTTYVSDLSISDVVADVDYETTFYPVWRNDVAATEDPSDFLSGVVLTYGEGDDDAVVVTDSDLADQFDYWVIPYSFTRAKTETWATARANNIVAAQGKEAVTLQPSLLIPNRLHPKLRAGMSISVRSDAAFGGEDQGTAQMKRISNIEWEPAGINAFGEECMWANLQLDQPLRILTQPDPNHEMPPQPASCDAAPSVLRHWQPTSLAQQSGMTVEGNANTALLAFFIHNAAAADPSASYDPDTVDVTSPTYNFTKYGELVNTGGSTTDLQITVLTLLNPPASNGALGGVTVVDGGDHFSWGILLLQDIDADSLIRTDDSFLGTTDSATSCSNTIASQANELILSILGYTTQQSGADAAAPGASQTLLMSWDGSGVSAGQDQFIGGISSQAATGSSTVDSWTQSGGLGGALTQWDLAVASCPAAITIGGPGEGTTGDDGTYVPGGTVVEHGDLSGKGGIMHDDTQIEVDPTGLDNTDGTTVHAVIEDFDAAITAAGGGTPYTDEKAQDAVGTILTDSSTIDFTYTDATPSITAAVLPAGIKLDDLGTPDDNTDLDASTSEHGLLPKLSGTSTEYLDGSGAWSTPAGGGGGGGGLAATRYGYQTPGASYDSTGSRIFLKKFTTGAAALVQGLAVSVKGNGANIRGLVSGIYADNAGVPGNAVARGDGGASNTQGFHMSTTQRWVWLPLFGDLAAATSYWMAVQIQGGGGVMSLAYDGSGTDYYIGAGGDWFSDASLVTPTSTTNKWSMYIVTLE